MAEPKLPEGFKLEVNEANSKGALLSVYAPNGERVADASFNTDIKGSGEWKEVDEEFLPKKGEMYVGLIEIDPKYRRMGIATYLYWKAEQLTGNKLIRSPAQTDMAEKVWDQPHRPFGSLDLETLYSRTEDIIITASTKPLNRYSLKPGAKFGRPGHDEFVVLELSGNTIYYKNAKTQKVQYKKVDVLLQEWYDKGYSEISEMDEIIEKVKEVLTPFLSGAIIAALIAWLKPRFK
jgi:hypothetical protein